MFWFFGHRACGVLPPQFSSVQSSSVAQSCPTIHDPMNCSTPGLPAAAGAAKSLQLCPTLCNPIDGLPPGSAVPGILQARTPEWVDISFSNAWKWKVKVKSLSRVRLFATPWIAAHQASLSITNSRSLLKPTSIESVMPSSHLILCCPLLLLPPIPPSIRIFSNESTLLMRWPKYWSFSFSISPSNEHWSPLRWTGWISLQSKGLSRVFSNTPVEKHQVLHMLNKV